MNASASFSALLRSKPSTFKTGKDVEIFFFCSVPVFNPALQIGSNNDLLPSTKLTCPETFVFNVFCTCKRQSMTSLLVPRPVVRLLAGRLQKFEIILFRISFKVPSMLKMQLFICWCHFFMKLQGKHI